MEIFISTQVGVSARHWKMWSRGSKDDVFHKDKQGKGGKPIWAWIKFKQRNADFPLNKKASVPHSLDLTAQFRKKRGGKKKRERNQPADRGFLCSCSCCSSWEDGAVHRLVLSAACRPRRDVQPRLRSVALRERAEKKHLKLSSVVALLSHHPGVQGLCGYCRLWLLF